MFTMEKIVRAGYFDALNNQSVEIENTFYFPGGTKNIPADVPECGFSQ